MKQYFFPYLTGFMKKIYKHRLSLLLVSALALLLVAGLSFTHSPHKRISSYSQGKM